MSRYGIPIFVKNRFDLTDQTILVLEGVGGSIPKDLYVKVIIADAHTDGFGSFIFTNQLDTCWIVLIKDNLAVVCILHLDSGIIIHLR